MRILIADDDAVSRSLLHAALSSTGDEVLEVEDGVEALQVLEGEASPRMALLDWVMPRADGLEVCRRVRRNPASHYVYLLLVTSRDRRRDVLAGFEAGADDYLVKPCDPGELRSRVQVGKRILDLHDALRSKAAQLQAANEQVQRLQGRLPICMHCRKIRDGAARWHHLESYIEEHTEVSFTHSLCEGCRREHYPAVVSSNSK